MQNTGCLRKLRELMSDKKHVPKPLQAYIVFSEDAHYGEYTAKCDERRAFICGFKGSAGTAVITNNQALMWTDGRYYVQAAQQMDNNWTLMKDGQHDTLTTEEWLCKNLPSGSTIGVDPKYICYKNWIALESKLKQSGHKVIPVHSNLIDILWDDQPTRPKNPVKPHPLKYSGKPVSEKLDAIRKEMKNKNAGILVITQLDEIAWTLNLRGSDISYIPVFFSYLIIQPTSITIFIDIAKVNCDVTQHLKSEIGKSAYKIEPYEKIEEALKSLVESIKGVVWISEKSNYALVSLIPENILLAEITPPALMKVVKNKVEIEGFKKAHIRDAAAVCCYFSWLEDQLNKGNVVTEISGSKQLEKFREEQKHFVSLSFETVSSVGEHAAIIHYGPSPDTDVPITKTSVYLCDSGGQYLDGTTDITRTMHFGKPTEDEKRFSTLVLKCQISLARIIFPAKTKGCCLDSFARKDLWKFGLDFRHGTGHGVGAYLNVHEGPIRISSRATTDDPGVDVGNVFSNEPGYYEDGKFGFRHEDLMVTVKADTEFNFSNTGFCKFEIISFVPAQRNLIAIEMLTQEEIQYLNNYHKKCREIVGPLLEKLGKTEAKAWLWKETEKI